jgi:hypothetical protein
MPSWIPDNANFEVNPQKRCIVLLPCVGLRENRSIRSRITTLFRNPIWAVGSHLGFPIMQIMK